MLQNTIYEPSGKGPSYYIHLRKAWHRREKTYLKRMRLYGRSSYSQNLDYGNRMAP